VSANVGEQVRMMSAESFVVPAMHLAGCRQQALAVEAVPVSELAGARVDAERSQLR
jgi:hypothetical protein